MPYRDEFELHARINELEEENRDLAAQNKELRFQREMSAKTIALLRRVIDDLQGSQTRMTFVIIVLLLSMAASSIHSSFWG